MASVGRICIGILVIAAVAGASGCSRTEFSAVPNIPVLYYECAEVTPRDLCNAYYSHYYDVHAARYLYNDRIFILKGIELTAGRLSHIDEGFMWIEDIKCYLLDASIAEIKARFKQGDMVDVIGINTGIGTDLEVPVGLVFKDCAVIPSGSLGLPMEGNDKAIAAPY